jgi:hypothetical protein
VSTGNDEFREAFPDLADLRFPRPTRFDVVGPDMGEDESPDADER